MMEYADAPRPDTLDDENDQTGAPIFDVPDRKMVAIEHPCVVINLDKGLATFGPEPDFQKVGADILFSNTILKHHTKITS